MKNIWYNIILYFFLKIEKKNIIIKDNIYYKYYKNINRIKLRLSGSNPFKIEHGLKKPNFSI